ncbi:MAG: SpoVG family protein [Planctomycetota bacterium]
MRITEIRVQILSRPTSADGNHEGGASPPKAPAASPSDTRADDKLRAFVRITVDDALVVRDIKVIEGPHGPFVAMPSRRLMERCPACSGRNPLGARFCASCGAPVRPRAGAPLGARRYADVCHPVNQAARAELEAVVLGEYWAERERSEQPGYQVTVLDEVDLALDP